MTNTRKDNPFKQTQITVKIPNKIRKRLTMHEKKEK